ncbi:efflux RND transporter periplasmic adaptor subunit [Paenibacillus sp. GD4]|jgi:HlyD family secretion protein|uniref:efflux RND transporter periplasmic adaptor subunit n=1 Tax=Paenibacillus sp. GD4 TaxID=3068890 RepID=UPI002796E125|nr:efflux RND transporter periplasmic adaptor subunit [Paenibacillus sp. GD4]MDQ1910407.1 efflux RND transporter periplasmic adaptor subunit [Paenibacillus sp. GD4]
MRRKRRKRHSLLLPIRRRSMAIGVIALSTLFTASCSGVDALIANSTGSAQEQQVKTVRTEKVTKQKIGDPVEQNGEVLSSVQIGALAKVGGDVEQIVKKRGDAVQEGDVILRLSSPDLKLARDRAALALQAAQDNLAKARSEQEKARKEQEDQKSELRKSITRLEQSLTDLRKGYNKTRNEYDRGQATKAQLDQAEKALQSGELELGLLKEQQRTSSAFGAPPVSTVEQNQAEMTLQQAEQALQQLEVKAPASGVLTEMPIELGMTVAGGAQIGLIEKLDPIKIKVNLSVDAAKFVRSKKELTYYIPETPQRTKAEVSYLASVIDPQTKAYELNLSVPNKDMQLKPGMRVRVELTEEAEQIVLAVPTHAVLKEGDNAYIYVLKGDTAEKRRVELGRLNEPLQEVLSGVQEGEELIVSGLSELKPGEKVTKTNAGQVSGK